MADGCTRRPQEPKTQGPDKPLLLTIVPGFATHRRRIPKETVDQPKIQINMKKIHTMITNLMKNLTRTTTKRRHVKQID